MWIAGKRHLVADLSTPAVARDDTYHLHVLYIVVVVLY